MSQFPSQITPSERLREVKHMELNGNLEEVVRFLRSLLGENDDFIVRSFQLYGCYPAAMFYFDDMVDQAGINNDVLKALMDMPPKFRGKKQAIGQLKESILWDALYYTKAQLASELAALVEGVLHGEAVVVVDRFNEAFVIGTRSIAKRRIDSPL